MPTTKSSATESDTEPKHSNNGNGKTPAKPISLYPMSEEEAVRRLLRVPPPEREGKSHGARD